MLRESYEGTEYLYLVNKKLSSYIYTHKIYDCEHQGDLDSELRLFTGLPCNIVSTFWDGKDGGDAYIEYSVATLEDLFTCQRRFGDFDYYDFIYQFMSVLVYAEHVENDGSVTRYTVTDGKLEKESLGVVMPETQESSDESAWFKKFKHFLDSLKGNSHLLITEDSVDSLSFQLHPLFGCYDFTTNKEAEVIESESTGFTLTFDEFVSAFEALEDNGYLLNDTISGMLKLPYYGMDAYDFSNADYPYARIRKREGDRIYLSSDFDLPSGFENPLDVDEFDDIFSMVTGYTYLDVLK